MKTKYGITQTFLYGMMFLAIISVGLVGYFWIADEYKASKKEEVTLRQEYVENQKNLIKNETERVIDYINYKHSQAEVRLKQVIRSRTNEAYTVASHLYTKYKSVMDSASIQEIIKEALRSIRYNNQRGYFFITRLDGLEILFADRPEMEGLNLIDMQDTQGKYVIRDMIDIIRRSGKGFYRYTWTKPNETGKDFPKIAYITHFKPFDWLIGTGEYLDDVVRDIQHEVLERLEKITFDDKGYIFVGQWNGLSLSGPAKGRNMIDVTDVNGIKIVQQLIRVSKSGGGFVSYVMPMIDSDVTYRKLSYTTAIPEWKWYVGAGVNVDKIEHIIAQKKIALQNRVRNHILRVTAILLAILIVILLVVRYVSNKTKKSFNLFAEFFAKAATESAKIDSEMLPFAEFEVLAQSANRMIRERNTFENALRGSVRNYRELVQSANSIIMRMDTEGKVLFFNKYAQDFFGYREEDILGKNVIGTIVPQRDSAGTDLAVMIRKIGTYPERYVANENENMRHNGERVRVAWMNKAIYTDNGEVKEILCVGIDVTEKWHLQKRLSQAQKMEAIGTLAGGIAHDFNNILSAIIGYTELALIDIPEGSELRNNLQQVLKAGGRAKELVQQILTFGRQRDQEQQPVRVNLIVNEALKLLRASLPSTITIRHKIQSDLAVMSDPTNIHQVLMNLCTNASYAMREQGGTLGVFLTDTDITSEFAKQHPGINPGTFILLIVSDTGHGMPPEVLERIFDPFFTTKKKGEGTGMGLSVVHGIVKSHGGTIIVESTPEEGSTFYVYLPAIETDSVVQAKSANIMVTGTERILFVDDEAFQADIGRQMLERLGYQVTTQTNSADALTLFRKNPEAFDLVITDMTMPNMTGDILAQKMMSVRPDIPIIVCTGYSQRINKQKAKDMGIKELVMKPVVMQDIADMIRRTLDDTKADSRKTSKPA